LGGLTSIVEILYLLSLWWETKETNQPDVHFRNFVSRNTSVHKKMLPFHSTYNRRALKRESAIFKGIPYIQLRNPST